MTFQDEMSYKDMVERRSARSSESHHNQSTDFMSDEMSPINRKSSIDNRYS